MRKWMTIQLFIVVFLNLPAFAGNVDILQVESRMEERITQLVRLWDPNSQAVVKAVLKKNHTLLPGVGNASIDLYIPGRFERIDIQDISEFQITIISSKTEMPKWLTEQINRLIDFQGIKKTVALKKEDLPQSLSYEKMYLDWKDEVAGFSQKTFFGAVALGTMIGFCILLIAVIVAIALRRGLREHMGGLRSLAENLSGSLPKSSRAPTMESSSAPSKNEPVGSSSIDSSATEIHHLSDAVLKNVFSDCYWCEEDRYAAWLWEEMNESQKRTLMQELPFAQAYAALIFQLEPQTRNFHRDPTYLNSISFTHISNDDLCKSLQHYPEIWNSLPELRKTHINLSLEQRLQLTKKARGVLFSSWDQLKESPFRVLSDSWSNFELTSDDDLYLLHNSESVPKERRLQLQSLVWLALLPKEIAQNILGEYTADELASAWVAPAEILQTLEALLPEKKLKMIHGFLERSPASRSSWVIAELTAKAVNALPEPEALPNAA